MTLRNSCLISIGLLSLFTTETFALSSDANAKLFLNAASATLNFETGVSTYDGNVKLDQATTHLTADSLIIYTNKQNRLRQATAIGKPAKYRTLPELHKPEFHADANIIDYYPEKNLLVFTGDAKAYQNKDVYTGPRIEYNTALQTVISPSSAKGRTTMIIHQNNQIKD